jgi:hypothetical protein
MNLKNESLLIFGTGGSKQLILKGEKKNNIYKVV